MVLNIIGIYSYYTEIFSTLPETSLQNLVYYYIWRDSAFKSWIKRSKNMCKKKDALKQGYFLVQTSSNNYDLISFPASTM